MNLAMKHGHEPQRLANMLDVLRGPKAPPLISCQRYLDEATVQRKADQFSVFIVRIHECELRGKRYRMIIDGHHNYAAAKLRGVEPVFRVPGAKFLRHLGKMSPRQQEAFLINNLTDCPHYYVETGEIVTELEPRMEIGP